MKKEDHAIYHKLCVDKPGSVPCFRCNEIIKLPQQAYMAIYTHFDRDNNSLNKYLYFHVDCFKQIAGDYYIVES